jgi:Uma2 family endonuclease
MIPGSLKSICTRHPLCKTEAMTTLASPKSRAPADGRVLLRGVSWETYERLLAEHNEMAGPKFVYDDGFLEIMTLSIEHEQPGRTLALLVDLIAGELEIDVAQAGSNTFKRADLKKGFEPDSCFFFSDPASIRGRKRLDLSVDPPPDLVIEIEVTAPLLPRLPIFAAVGVPEVWCCEKNDVRILRLDQGRKGYREVKRNAVLPPVTGEIVSGFLRSSVRMKSFVWARAVREWAQAQRR